MKTIAFLILGAFVALFVYSLAFRKTVMIQAPHSSIVFDVSVDKDVNIGDTVQTQWCNGCKVVYIY